VREQYFHRVTIGADPEGEVEVVHWRVTVPEVPDAVLEIAAAATDAMSVKKLRPTSSGVELLLSPALCSDL